MSQSRSKAAALVTGASSGIGATYADRLAKLGHDLVLVARDGSRLEKLAARLRSEAGVKIDLVPADLTVKADLGRIERRLREDPKIEMLVNNAGVAASGAFAEADLDRLESMIQLNVVALTRLAGAAVPGFVARGRGTIINVASVVGLMPELQMPVYGGTKAYVLHFTQALHQQIGKSGVRLQAVLPGATRTEIWERAGMDVSQVDPSRLMQVDEMVDAALVGLDRGELVTIPSLPDPSDWNAFDEARLKLAPNLSRDHAAQRYRTAENLPV